jgi:hypothetical protein
VSLMMGVVMLNMIKLNVNMISIIMLSIFMFLIVKPGGMVILSYVLSLMMSVIMLSVAC